MGSVVFWDVLLLDMIESEYTMFGETAEIMPIPKKRAQIHGATQYTYNMQTLNQEMSWGGWWENDIFYCDTVGLYWCSKNWIVSSFSFETRISYNIFLRDFG
jgi:hypothetical protein